MINLILIIFFYLLFVLILPYNDKYERKNATNTI